MNKILANIWRGKQSQIILVAIALNIALIFFVSGTFDLMTCAVYLISGLMVASLMKLEKSQEFFIAGAAIPVVYNILFGFVLTAFSVTIMFVIIAALEQGIIAWAVAKIHGVQ